MEVSVFLFVLFFSGICIYEVVIATIKYYGYPVQTNIQPMTSFVYEFPAVTICNQNPIRKSQLMQAGSAAIVNILVRIYLLKPFDTSAL